MDEIRPFQQPPTYGSQCNQMAVCSGPQSVRLHSSIAKPPHPEQYVVQAEPTRLNRHSKLRTKGDTGAQRAPRHLPVISLPSIPRRASPKQSLNRGGVLGRIRLVVVGPRLEVDDVPLRLPQPGPKTPFVFLSIIQGKDPWQAGTTSGPVFKCWSERGHLYPIFSRALGFIGARVPGRGPP